VLENRGYGGALAEIEAANLQKASLNLCRKAQNAVANGKEGKILPILNCS